MLALRNDWRCLGRKREESGINESDREDSKVMCYIAHEQEVMNGRMLASCFGGDEQ